MTNTVSLVMKKLTKMPTAAQDQFAFEMLDRIAAWEELREKIAVGVRQLNAGLGRPWSKKEMLAEFRKRHAARKKK